MSDSVDVKSKIDEEQSPKMSPSISSKRLSAPVHNSVCHFIFIVPTSYVIMSKFIGFKRDLSMRFSLLFVFQLVFERKSDYNATALNQWPIQKR